jgi:squalene-associated FAD-dependent desaturase
MSADTSSNPQARFRAEGAPRIAIVGGGLAGLAAAVALAGRGFRIDLFEARNRLGGRATSFRDPNSGELVDHCQHVSMGCCTNLADFCRRTGIADQFTRQRVLHFYSPEGRRYRLAASRWLPAPLHLLPGLLRLGYLSRGERLGIVRAMLRMIRTPDDVDACDPNATTVDQWLRAQRQSPRAIERFWSVVLTSALGESVQHASLAHARKVFIDGFLASRTAYEIEVPKVPLGNLYGRRLEDWLAHHDIALHLGEAVAQIDADSRGAKGLLLRDGARKAADAVVVAAPWQRVAALIPPAAAALLPWLAGLDDLGASPITGVHLWFDRPIFPLPNAALVGMLSQWVFNRGTNAREDSADLENYYQVVISASRQIVGRDRADVVEEICADLRRVWPAAKAARLLRWRLVTEQSAVFSVRPGIERLRPAQQTAIDRLFVAGDWTHTGWPATMEGAVRSGYLAAEAVLQTFGRSERLLVADLPRGTVARLILGRPIEQS